MFRKKNSHFIDDKMRIQNNTEINQKVFDLTRFDLHQFHLSH